MRLCWKPANSFTYLATPLALLFVFLTTSSLIAQDNEKEKLANEIGSKATLAQNGKEFDFAAKQWERLLTEYPNSSLVGKAHFNLGVCSIELLNYDKAITEFEKSIPLLKDKQKVPTAKFYLGYSQLERGNEWVSEKNVEKANESYTTATRTFAELLKSHNDFEQADQVCFFQAGAFEKLNRLDEALESYKNMANFKSTNSSFRFDSLFAICDLHESLGQYGEAIKACDRFINVTQADGHPLLDNVKLLKGKVLANLGESDQENGNAEDANTKFAQADAIFRQIIEADAASKSDGYDGLVIEAKYQRAFVLARTKEYEEAGKIYSDLVTSGDPELADQVQAYAGANFLSAGKLDLAIAALTKSTNSDSKYAVESAHLLAGIFLKQQKFQQAYDVAKTFIGKAAELESPVLVDLKLDQADAAYSLDQRRKESITLFNAIVDQHPKHRLAAPALYNSAFASLELNDLKAAIATSTRFEKEYADSDYLGDTLEVKADALMLDGQYDQAATTFKELVTDQRFNKSAKAKIWQLRSGLALFLQEKYGETIAELTPIAGELQANERNAEAFHWIASSHYQLKAFDKAETAFIQSIDADDDWSRTDESMSFLCRSQLQQNKVAEAKQTAQQLIDKSPKSKWLSDVYYQLGNRALDDEQYAEALKNFNQVIENFADAPQLPASLYGAAWCHQMEKQFEQAGKLYDQLVDKFPDHKLVKNAKVQRASLQRRMGKSGASIAQLEELLKTDIEDSQRVNVLLELGLAQVNTEKWSEAIASFKELIDLAPNDKRLDDFYYEIAWAYRSDNKEDEAVEYFGKIADEQPNSPHAAEANFHLGNAAYSNNKYIEAVKRFNNCLKPESDAVIREKASYKLAWAHYKQEQFPQAESAFRSQVDLFSDGELYADGAFMLAESIFRQKKYPAAYDAYLNAQKAIDASETVDQKLKWLTMLHGAQSANKSKNYEGALSLAGGIEDTSADESFKQDVYLEMGTAHNGLKAKEQALTYWRKASDSRGKTGARAFCMIGNQFSASKKFEQAINQYREVFFGFGGTNAPDDIKPWQAYARYEAARCHYVQVKTAEEDLKKPLIANAIKHFEALVKDYPDDRLAPEARKQLADLKKLQSSSN